MQNIHWNEDEFLLKRPGDVKREVSREMSR